MTATIHALRIRNFQSLHDVSLELLPFTVIVGPSSSGKSALTRALRTLVSNRRGTEWITYGERIASISATTDAGTVTLTRSRTQSSADNSYRIIPAGNPDDERTYAKLGGDTPEDVSRFLGIPSSSPINFAGQFDKPYLLDDSTAEVARTLGALTNVTVIFEGARESNRRKLASAQTLRTRSDDLQAIRARIPEFKSLRSQDNALATAESKIEHARQIERRIARLTEALTVFEIVEPTIPGLTAQASVKVPTEERLLRAHNALQSFQKRLALVPTYARAVTSAQEAYDAVEAEEAQALANYAARAGSLTQDVSVFFHGLVDRALVIEHAGNEYVPIGHAVEIFIRYLETKAGA